MLVIQINHLFGMVKKMNQHLHVKLTMVNNPLYVDPMVIMNRHLYDVLIVQHPKKHSFVELMVDRMVKKLLSDVQMVQIIKEIIT
jgi:hypothetical protein